MVAHRENAYTHSPVGLLPAWCWTFAINLTVTLNPQKPPLVYAVPSPILGLLFWGIWEKTEESKMNRIHLWGFRGLGGLYRTVVAKLGGDVDDKPAVGSGATAI